jgi:hypothetical protein
MYIPSLSGILTAVSVPCGGVAQVDDHHWFVCAAARKSQAVRIQFSGQPSTRTLNVVYWS